MRWILTTLVFRAQTYPGNITSSFPNPSALATNATVFEEAKQLYLSERTGPLTKALSTYIGFLSLETVAGAEDAASLLDEAAAASPGDFLPSMYAKDERLVAGLKAQRDVLASANGAGEAALLEIPIPGGGLLPTSMQKPLSRGTVLHVLATRLTGRSSSGVTSKKRDALRSNAHDRNRLFSQHLRSTLSQPTPRATPQSSTTHSPTPSTASLSTTASPSRAGSSPPPPSCSSTPSKPCQARTTPPSTPSCPASWPPAPIRPVYGTRAAAFQ